MLDTLSSRDISESLFIDIILFRSSDEWRRKYIVTILRYPRAHLSNLLTALEYNVFDTRIIFRSNKLLPQLVVFSLSIRTYRLSKSLVSQWQRFLRIISPTQGILRISYTRQVPRLVSGWLRPWSRGDIAINIQFKGYFRKTLHDCLFWQWLSQASGDTALGIAKNCKIIRQFTAPLKQ